MNTWDFRIRLQDLIVRDLHENARWDRELSQTLPTNLEQLIEHAVSQAVGEALAAALRETEEILTRRECANVLGYSEKTMDNLAATKQGPPFHKYGKKCFYLRSEVIAWVRSLPPSTASAETFSSPAVRGESECQAGDRF